MGNDFPISVKNQKIYIAQSMTASSSSIEADLAEVSLASVQAVWTGTPVGTLTLEASAFADASHFATVDTVALAGAAGSQIWDLGLTGYRYVRLSYTLGSSTGTIDAIVNAKLT